MKETRLQKPKPLTNEQVFINRGYPKSRVAEMLQAVPPEVLRKMDAAKTPNEKLALYNEALAAAKATVEEPDPPAETNA